MSKNFYITKEKFEILRDQLLDGKEDLFELIFLTHFEDCRNFLINKYGCEAEDAYDATMETLIIFRKKIIDGKIEYDNLRFLFTKMASQVLVKDLRFRKKQKIASQKHIEWQDNSTIDTTILNKSWEKLGENCQKILKKFYYSQASLKEIAEETDVNYSALRKQKERCIQRLRLLFQQYQKAF